MKPNNALGARVRQLRTEKGLSQEDLSKRLGCVSRGQICRIENGIRNADRLVIREMARVFGVTESYLIYGEDDPTLLSETPCADIFRIRGRPKGRTAVQLYPETSDTLHFLARKHGITTPELLEQIVEFALSHMDV